MRQKHLPGSALATVLDHLERRPVALYLRTPAANAVEDLRKLMEIQRLPYVVMRAPFGARLVKRVAP